MKKSLGAGIALSAVFAAAAAFIWAGEKRREGQEKNGEASRKYPLGLKLRRIQMAGADQPQFLFARDDNFQSRMARRGPYCLI